MDKPSSPSRGPLEKILSRIPSHSYIPPNEEEQRYLDKVASMLSFGAKKLDEFEKIKLLDLYREHKSRRRWRFRGEKARKKGEF